MADRSRRRTSDGGATATAFLVAGISLSLAILLVALSGATALAPPRWLPASLGLTGLLAALVGLFGYYPVVADRSPRLAALAIFAAALGLAVFGVGVLADLAGGGALGERGSGSTLLFVGSLLALVTSFCCYGVASSRAGVPSKEVGTLLLLPAAGVLGNILYVLVSNALGVPVVQGLPTALFLIAALAIAALGYRLRRVGVSDPTGDRAETAT